MMQVKMYPEGQVLDAAVKVTVLDAYAHIGMRLLAYMHFGGQQVIVQILTVSLLPIWETEREFWQLASGRTGE